MKKCFLLTLDLPEWADDPERLELVREEVEQHGGAAAAFYTQATHVGAKCETIHPLTAAALGVGVL